jgi:hypothetical protein
MRRLAAIEYISLDGVVQAPGHAAEDPGGGFEHGGWTAPFMAEHRRYISESFQTVDAFLLGRITYESSPPSGQQSPTRTTRSRMHSTAARSTFVSTTLTDPAWHQRHRPGQLTHFRAWLLY